MYDLSVSKLEFRVAGQGDELFQVIRYRGTDGLSLLFRFEVELVSGLGSQRLGDLVGQPATFEIEAPSGVRRFHGIIGRMQHLGEHAGETCYRAELVPRLWLLTHGYHCRIFQHKTVAEIVHEVLQRAGLVDAKFRVNWCLVDKHPRRDYCVQYRETDFNFISRLMEEEGIFYYFEHDENETRMVVADSAFFHPLDAEDCSLAFRPPAGMNAPDEHVFQFLPSEEVRPNRVVLRDYNYTNPSLNLQCHWGREKHGSLEVSDYPGEYDWQADGNWLATIRAEELQCRRKTAAGRSNSSRLDAGITFALREHPNRECNGEYLVTRATYRGRQAVAHTFEEELGAGGVLGPGLRAVLDQASRHDDQAVRDLGRCVQELARHVRRSGPSDARSVGPWLLHGGQVTTDPVAIAAARGGDPLDWLGTLNQLGGDGLPDTSAPIFECEFECIPSEVTFRPPRVTPKPLMRGTQTAVVVGPEDEEIHTDELGRVKVQFYWDREGQRDERSSCWIRTSQPWAGAGYGGIAIPRIGQEVIVDFLEGDPDRPIITGRVYNAEQMQPHDLPASQVTTPSGKQPIPEMQGRASGLPAAKTRTTMKSNSTPGGGGANEICFDDAKGGELLFVNATKDAVRTVGNNDRTTVGADQQLSVGANQSEFVGANRDRHVGANESIHVGANRTKNVVANETSTIGVNQVVQVGTDIMVDAGANILINAGTSITLQCGASRIHMNQAGFISITGTVITSAASVNNSMVAPLTEVVGAVMLTQAGAVVLVEGGATHVRGEVLAALKGATVNVVADGDNVMQGGLVKIN